MPIANMTSAKMSHNSEVVGWSARLDGHGLMTRVLINALASAFTARMSHVCRNMHSACDISWTDSRFNLDAFICTGYIYAKNKTQRLRLF